MFCFKCGKSISADSMFCPFCGANQQQPNSLAQTSTNNHYNIDNIVATPTDNLQYNSESATTTTSKDVAASTIASLNNQNNAQINQPNYTTQPNYNAQSNYNNQAYTQPQYAQQPQKPTNKSLKFIVAGVAVAVVAFIVAILFATGGFKRMFPTKITLNKYIDVTYEGFNGTATAKVEFNAASFERDYGSKISKSSSVDLTTFFDDNFTYTFTPNEDLSNDDSVTLRVDINNDSLISAYGCKFEYLPKQYKVSGLAELKTFDAFNGIGITTSGANGEATCAVDRSHANAYLPKELIYTVDRTSGLRNNDVVTITISIEGQGDVNQHCIEKYGKKPAELTHQFTVSGLQEKADTSSNTQQAAVQTPIIVLPSYITPGVAVTGNAPTYSSYDPNYFLSTYQLSSYEVSGWSNDEIRNSINYLYAIHGYWFSKSDLFNYYCQFAWYNPVTKDQETVKSWFNYTELKNWEVLTAERARR